MDIIHYNILYALYYILYIFSIQLTLDQHGFELCLAVSSYQLQQMSCCISLLAELRVDKE